MTDFTLDLRVADSFATRARGLLFSKPLPAGRGLLLPGVSAVHGLLMNRPLDLAFLRADGRVLALASLPPGRLRWCRGAKAVVEFEAGQLVALGIRVGDRIRARVATRRGGLGRFASAPRSIAGALIPLALMAALTGVVPPGSGLVASIAWADQGSARPEPRSMTAKLPPAWIARFADRAEKLYQSGADEEAIAAFATWLDADPGAEAIVILRIGNIHQRSGRDWLAIDSYRRALDLAPTADPAAAEARRKALANLEGLLEVVSHRVADVLGPASGAAAQPSPGSRAAASPSPGSRAAPGRVAPSTPSMPSAVPRRDASPGRDLPMPRRSPPVAIPVAGFPAGADLASGADSASSNPSSNPSTRPSRPRRGPTGAASSAGAVPTVEYLGHR